MILKSTFLTAVVLACSVSPLAHAAPASGVLVSRVDSERWSLRVIAGSQPVAWRGVVEASAAFYTASGARLESGDSVTLVAPDRLEATLRAWPGGSDEVRFSIASTASLCLRIGEAAGLDVYMGDTLADAVRVTTPASLQGKDACGTAINEATVQDAVTATGTRKYHPGHYLALMRGNDDPAVMAASLKPGVKGFLKRYTWRSLEPALGNYDFSELQADLNWAAANGTRLIAMIEDKTFVLERPTPAYLDAYTIRNRAGGYTVLRWNSYVVARQKALVTALGRFDANPAFEGIATQETALGFDNALLDAKGYTPEKYRDAYIAVLSAAANAMPTSRVFWFMNFFPRNQDYIGSIASATAAKGVIMGGPDVLPDDGPLVTRTYPFFDQFQYKMPLFGQVEPVCYAALHETWGYATKYWTMAELFRYARDDLHVDYMFWVRLPKPSPSDAYDWLDALPVIANNQTFNQQ